MTDRTRSGLWHRVRVCLGIALGGALIVSGAYLTFSAPSGGAEAKPPVTPTASPTPSPSKSAVPTPTATPTPTPTPEAPTVACVAAHISAPTIGLEAEVGEYTYEQAQAEGGVNPPILPQAVWYSGFFRHDGIKSIMSNDADDAVYVYGHAYQDFNKGAVFDHIAELKVGDTLTVTACGEVVTLVVQDVFDISKSDLTNDARVYTTEPHPGKWVFLTCNRDGPRSADGHTTQNTAAVLQVQLPEPELTPQAAQLERRLADRLK